MKSTPVLGIIGGSGLYNLPALTHLEPHEIDTPYGRPSSPVWTGSINGRTVAFLARHGVGHFISPGEVNYRANIFALKMMGVKRIVSISACGSLREDYKPGEIVIPDQLVDFTRSRKNTFFGDGLVAHISPADPYCSSLSSLTLQAVQKAGATAHFGGTLITIEGPRFSTRGESNLFRSWGMSIIGMTACPEAFLAREAQLCYCTMAHVTDYDVWHMSESPVTVEMVIRTLNQNTTIAQEAVVHLTASLPEETECECHHALRDAVITAPEKINEEGLARLNWLKQ